MADNLLFHHLGIATFNLERAIQVYNDIGYQIISKKIFVPTQKVNVCFMSKANHPLLELIEPTEITSPISNILKKNSPGPYHICYSTGDISKTIIKLCKMRFHLLDSPTKSSAFNNNLICFLYNKDIGLLEIVELKKTIL